MSIASILARFHVEKAVHARLRREKIKPSEVADLQRMAAAYLAEHRAELLELPLATFERTCRDVCLVPKRTLRHTSIQEEYHDGP